MGQVEVSNFLQGLQGAQPVVVLAFLALQRALCLADLQKYTGKSADALTVAVNCLESKVLLVRQNGAHGKPYWLPAGDSFIAVLGQTPVFAESGAVVDVDESLENNLFTITSTTSSYTGQTPVFAESGKGRVISRITTHKTDAEIAECLAVLKELDIHGRKAEHLALYDWINPEYIRVHVEQALKDTRWDNPLGMAIYWMEQKFPVTVAEPVPEKKGRYSYSRSSFDLGSMDAGDDQELQP